MGFALLVARLILGLGIGAHGAQKLFGWFGGFGPKATGQAFESLGFRPGVLFAVTAGLGEFVGGLLTALGLLNPIGPALLVAVMLTAIISVHWKNGFFATSNGLEFPLMNIGGIIALAFAGPGPLSLESWVRIPDLSDPAMIWIILGIGIFGSLLSLTARRQPSVPAHT